MSGPKREEEASGSLFKPTLLIGPRIVREARGSLRREERMIKNFLRRLILIHKEAVLMEVLTIKGLMQLLMKTRNTDEKWTREEKREIKKHLKNIVKIVPAVVIFSLPGGLFLLPFLSEVLDRRKARRG